MAVHDEPSSTPSESADGIEHARTADDPAAHGEVDGARDDDLRRCELTLGIRLPDALRTRLRHANGFAIDDEAGPTGTRWRILPVHDTSTPARDRATAADVARRTALARAPLASPPPGGGRAATAFPSDGVVIGHGVSPLDLLVLRADPSTPGVLGQALYRRNGSRPLEDLGARFVDLAPDPGPFDAGAPLPRFRYHERPDLTGAIRRSVRACAVCERRRGWIGPLGPEPVCPWCIADGHDAGTCPDFFDAPVPPEVEHEVRYATPGFVGWQVERWLTHCGDAAVYLGTAAREHLVLLPDARAALRAEGIDEETIATIEPEGELLAHLFRCRHCGVHTAYADPA